MSERGSFVTEYVNCPKCFAAVLTALPTDPDEQDKYLCVVQVPGYDGMDPLPIVAGKVGGASSGGEVWLLDRLDEKLPPLLCHPLRVAVLCDNGSTAVRTFPPRYGRR